MTRPLLALLATVTGLCIAVAGLPNAMLYISVAKEIIDAMPF